MIRLADTAPMGCEWQVHGSQHDQYFVLVDKLTGRVIDTLYVKPTAVHGVKTQALNNPQTPKHLQELTFEHKLNFHQHAAIKEIIAGNLQEALAILQEAKALLDELPSN